MDLTWDLGGLDRVVVVEYWECAKRREESCCTGSGLRVERGVNLEADREKRKSVRMANRGVGSGGIMVIVEIIKKKKKKRKCVMFRRAIIQSEARH